MIKAAEDAKKQQPQPHTTAETAVHAQARMSFSPHPPRDSKAIGSPVYGNMDVTTSSSASSFSAASKGETITAPKGAVGNKRRAAAVATVADDQDDDHDEDDDEEVQATATSSSESQSGGRRGQAAHVPVNSPRRVRVMTGNTHTHTHTTSQKREL